MLVYSRIKAIIPGEAGKNEREKVRLHKGLVTDVPKWAAATAYFKALVADGKLVVTTKAHADKDAQAAEDAANTNKTDKAPDGGAAE